MINLPYSGQFMMPLSTDIGKKQGEKKTNAKEEKTFPYLESVFLDDGVLSTLSASDSATKSEK